MTIVSAEQQLKIAELRQKAKSGTMTLDDCKEAIRILRADRLNITPTKAASRAKPKAIAPDADDLLKDLGI